MSWRWICLALNRLKEFINKLPNHAVKYPREVTVKVIVMPAGIYTNDVILVTILLTWNMLKPCSSVSIVNFEQVNVD